MIITLSGEIEEIVNEQVRSGAFRSAEDVLLESLRLLKAWQERMAELRREIQAGVEAIQQGRYTVLTNDEDFDSFADEIISKGLERKNQANGQ